MIIYPSSTDRSLNVLQSLSSMMGEHIFFSGHNSGPFIRSKVPFGLSQRFDSVGRMCS